VSHPQSLNYIAACCHSPGRVPECVAPPARTAAGHYPEGAFEGWSYCRHPSCHAAKPPGTHHCRACGYCVVELDHHCPFINNVGGGTGSCGCSCCCGCCQALGQKGARLLCSSRQRSGPSQAICAPSRLSPSHPTPSKNTPTHHNTPTPRHPQCVGRANLRAFILFLACLVVACAYALVVCGGLIAAHWPHVSATMRGAAAAAAAHAAQYVGGRRGAGAGAGAAVGSGSSFAASTPLISSSSGGGGDGTSGGSSGGGVVHAITGVFVRASMLFTFLIAASPWWLIATYYLFVVCAAVLLCVGLLLAAQLRYLATGMTYIDYLQNQGRAAEEQHDRAHGSINGMNGGGKPGAGGGAEAAAAAMRRQQGLWRRLRDVMGGGNVLMWFLVPRWDPPAGTMLGPDAKKAE